jgi:DNA-binding response OmpR family regulator
VPKRRILVVEDEFLVRLILSEALTEAGYDVTEADGGEAGLSLLDGSTPFDVMITDLQMPGSADGMTVASHARKRFPSMPIIFATARPDNIGRFADRRPSDVVIGKPYGPEEVLATIREMLGS